MPWKDYKMYGKILLSGDRGERKLTILLFIKNLMKVFLQILKNQN
jgi:hypothetical protein